MATAEARVNAISRSVSIHLFNNSSLVLTNPQIYSVSGYCVCVPQPTVENGATVMCGFGKTTGSARGAVGVLTYDINEDRKMGEVKRLAIMFSVPYDYSLYENWFALGLFDTKTACDESLFQLMYYQQGYFTRGKGSGSEVKFQLDNYTLKGTMSPSAKSEVKVEIWHEPKVVDL